MNSAPGSEQHDDKRHNHYNLIGAAILVGVGIIVAGLLLLGGDGSGGRRTESRSTPVSGTPGSAGGQTEPRVSAFRGGSTPQATPGGSLLGTPTPRPAAATPTRTPTPSAPKATVTPAPKGTPLPPGEDPGDLELLADQDSFKYAVRKEWTGAIAADKLKVYQDIYEEIPGMVPTGTITPDRPFVVESSGVFVSPDRLQFTTRIGQNKDAEWIVGSRVARQFNTQSMKYATLSASYTVLDYLQAVIVWDNGIWHWWDQDPDVAVRCRDSNEKVNGYKVRECFPFAFTSDQVFNLVDLLGGDSFQHYDSFTLQIWLLQEDNIPTRMKLTVVGKDKDDQPEKMVLTVDVTEINSDSLSVDLPK